MAEGAHYRAPADEYTDTDRTGELAVLKDDRARIQKMAARGMLDLDEADAMLRENKTQTDALSADAQRHDLPQAIPWGAACRNAPRYPTPTSCARTVPRDENGGRTGRCAPHFHP